jgi:DASH complex subunit DAD2
MLKSIYQQKIAEKRQDLERLQEFKELTEQLATQLDQIGDKLDTMKDGAASVALILANWQNVIKSISLASLGLVNSQSSSNSLPEPLVRVRLDKDDESEETEPSEHIQDTQPQEVESDHEPQSEIELDRP